MLRFRRLILVHLHLEKELAIGLIDGFNVLGERDPDGILSLVIFSLGNHLTPWSLDVKVLGIGFQLRWQYDLGIVPFIQFLPLDNQICLQPQNRRLVDQLVFQFFRIVSIQINFCMLNDVIHQSRLMLRPHCTGDRLSSRWTCGYSWLSHCRRICGCVCFSHCR